MLVKTQMLHLINGGLMVIIQHQILWGFATNSYQYTFTEIGDHDVILEVADGTCADTISLVISVQVLLSLTLSPMEIISMIIFHLKIMEFLI